MAEGISIEQEFREGERVLAAADLPGAPKGSPGVVVTVTGLTWIRYRVRFENGTELNLLDGKLLDARPKGRRRGH